MATVFSYVASRNKRCRSALERWPELPHQAIASLYPVLRLLRFGEPRGPDASPSGGPQRSQAHCELPGARPAPKAQSILCPNSARFVLGHTLLKLFAASGGATSSVELQPAAWGGGELRGSANRKSNAFFCRVRPVAHSPRAAKPLGDEAGDPKGLHKHCPQLAPILRPVSASLRLRCRSAAAVARWDFTSILLPQNE